MIYFDLSISFFLGLFNFFSKSFSVENLLVSHESWLFKVQKSLKFLKL